MYPENLVYFLSYYFDIFQYLTTNDIRSEALSDGVVQILMDRVLKKEVRGLSSEEEVCGNEIVVALEAFFRSIEE
jgi:hypothetical protein